jgi:hypothetical protein
MARIHIITILELGDDGRWTTVRDASYETPHIPMRADRGAAGQAKQQGQVAGSTAGNLASQAQSAYSALEPGLARDANNPMGLTPTQRNQYNVSAREAIGGVNSGLTGEANLASARTRNAGGFSAALDEAARQKMRSQATATQQVNNLDTQLALQKQQEARRQLQGLYGTNTSGMLSAMGLQNQDLQSQLAAGRQGWLQNAEGVIGTLAGAAKAGAGAYADYKGA